MVNRRANAVLFGFDFQRNATIILMLENIKDLNSVRLEGNAEDIELTLDNGLKILAQAKAVEKSSHDFSHVRQNLKKALISLSEGAQKTTPQQLIFITNSPNPFNDLGSRSVFSGFPTRRSFSTLPPSAQKIVNNYLTNIENPLDLQKFTVQVFPFETDDEAERYKAVLQAINDFIGTLNVNSPGLGKWLLQIWNDNLFTNGSKRDPSIELSKKDIIWPILVHETDINRCEDDFLNQFELGVYEEIVRLYSTTIDSCCERIEFFTKILYDYIKFPSTKKAMEKCNDFIDNSWEKYKSEFSSGCIDDNTLEGLTKVVLYNVIRRRITINKVKQGVNL
ncbi:hypothetical protein [Levyella massiliensis]|uniref:hypothetical protein n=1 Tax=Levyella massiliensis TaxID=938289 RepID=UPI0023F51C39|nr:hypothetical protein [Levyella massiliensis]